MKKTLILLSLLLLQSLTGFSFDFYQDFFQKQDSNTTQTAQQFPYKAYLAHYSLQNLDTLFEHQTYIGQRGGDGEEFLFALCETYLELHPVKQEDPSSFQKVIELGSHFYKHSQTAPDSLQKALFIMADIILDSQAQQLAQAINEGKISKENASIKRLMEALRQCDYQLNLTETDSEKIQKHLQTGNWSYLWKKFHSRCMLDCLNGGRCSKICWCMGILPLFLLGILGAWFYKRKQKRPKQLSTK